MAQHNGPRNASLLMIFKLVKISSGLPSCGMDADVTNGITNRQAGRVCQSFGITSCTGHGYIRPPRIEVD